MQILLSDENKDTASSSSTTDSGISMSPSTTSTNGTDNTTVENLNLDDYKLDGKNQTIIYIFFSYSRSICFCCEVYSIDICVINTH